MNQKPVAPSPATPVDRQRLTVDLPMNLLLLLDHVGDVTGQSRTAVVVSLLAQHLPALYDQAKEVEKRVRERTQPGKR